MTLALRSKLRVTTTNSCKLRGNHILSVLFLNFPIFSLVRTVISNCCDEDHSLVWQNRSVLGSKIQMPQKSSSSEQIRLPPLIKWPGGKRALLDAIISVLPNRAGRYFEPFFGGGALFFALQPKYALLSDVNEELINLYLHVKESPRQLIELLKSYKNTEENYYRIRDQSPRLPIRRAARFLFLTTLSFNGIHRVNLKGQFNVPYGRKTYLRSFDEEKILAASGALSNAELVVADFEAATKDAQKGDLIYFDPPYTVAHAKNGFVKYNENIFSWEDQIRLSRHAMELHERGCHVIVSNADHPSVNDLYTEFNCITIERYSVIAASSDFRRMITESLYFGKTKKGTGNGKRR